MVHFGLVFRKYPQKWSCTCFYFNITVNTARQIVGYDAVILRLLVACPLEFFQLRSCTGLALAKESPDAQRRSGFAGGLASMACAGKSSRRVNTIHQWVHHTFRPIYLNIIIILVYYYMCEFIYIKEKTNPQCV